MLSSAISMSSDTVFTVKDAVVEVYNQIDRNCAGSKITGIATGFSEFDKRSGGLQGGNLVIIAAETGQGKSSLAGTIALNTAKNGARIVFYSQEMTKMELAGRLMAIETKISANALLHSRLDNYQIEQVHKNTQKIIDTSIYFDERSTNNIENILSSIRSMKIKHDINIVIVDYLQLVGTTKKGLTREQHVAEVARQLKNIAKELNITVLLLSQLSRDKDPQPKLSRLRDSGQIEEAADIVIFIYRPEYYGKDYPKDFEHISTTGTALIEVAKGRNIGIFKFILGFDEKLTHFYEDDISLRTDENKPEWYK
jgi:replicative DNA helicase